MRDFGFARTLRSQIVWKKLRNSKGEQFLAKMQIQANRVYYVGLRTYNGYQYNQKCRTAKLEIISIEKIRAGESTIT